MTKNEKRLNKVIDDMRQNGEWNELYTAITKVVLDDARSGIAESKRDRKTLVRFVDLYGTPEQRRELDYVFE